MKTGLRQIGFTLLTWTLLVYSAPKEARAQTEAVRSDQPHRRLRQTGPEGRPSQGTHDLEKVETSTGFVFVNGHYVCPPYRIASAGNEVSVNGVVLSARSLTQPNQPVRASRREVGGPAQRLARQLIHHLEQNALFIYLEPDTAVLIPYYQAAAILDTLSGGDSTDDKVQALTEGEVTTLARAVGHSG